MIRRLQVSNYRSLGNSVNVKLSQFTAFVGQNGSGKSNVVDVLRFLSDCMLIGLEGSITKRHGINAVRRWTSGHPVNLGIRVELDLPDGARGHYMFILASHGVHEFVVKAEEATVELDGELHRFRVEEGKWAVGPSELRPRIGPLHLALPLVAGDDRFRRLGDALSSMAVYTIFPDSLREPQKYDPARPMEQHGTNWVSVLKDQDTETWRNELVAALGRLTNDIDDMEIKQVSGYLLVRFRHGTSGKGERAKWFDAAQESDGTLRTAGIVTALLQEPPLYVIGVEEPELTVHPGAIPLVFDYLKQASTRSQIVVTTHSPELLDLLDPDDVRVVQREDGATTVYPMSAQQREAVRRGLLSVGEALRFEGIQPELPFDTGIE